MDTQIILVYCLCDDMLKAMQHREDAQCQLSDAEVMTVAMVAALNHNRGNFRQSERDALEHGYIACHARPESFQSSPASVKHCLLSLFALLASILQSENEESVYILDTFPISCV